MALLLQHTLCDSSHNQWHSERGAEGQTTPARNQEGVPKMVVITTKTVVKTAKMGGSDKGASGISKLLGGAKFQSTQGTGNPCDDAAACTQI